MHATGTAVGKISSKIKEQLIYERQMIDMSNLLMTHLN